MSYCLTTHLQRIYVLSRRPYPLDPTVAKFVIFHLGLQYCTETECSCTPCPKKDTPWLLSVGCCNLPAILLINPLNTVRLSSRSHQRSSALSSLPDSAADSESLFLPVYLAYYRRLHKNSLKVQLFLSPGPFPYSSSISDSCLVVSWSN